MFGNLMNLQGSLLDDLSRIQRELDAAFGTWPGGSGLRSSERGSYPPVNVGATEDKVEVYLFAAGLDPKGLAISIQRNLLTIAGERRVPSCEDATYYRDERYSGAFRRVITLPDDVDPDQVEAHYRDGVLQVSVKRREISRPRQIEVR